MRWLILGMAVVIIGYLWFKNRDTWARTWNRLTPTVRKILIVAFIVSLGFAVWFAAWGSLSKQIDKLKLNAAQHELAMKEKNIEIRQIQMKAVVDISIVRDEEAKKKAELQAKTDKANADLAVAIKKLVATPSDLLAVEMSAYISPEFFMVHPADNTFSTSRKGAENTQEKFLGWQNRGIEIDNLNAEIKKDAEADTEANGIREKADKETARLQANKDAETRGTMDALKGAVRKLERQRFWKQFEGWFEGGAVVYLACRVFPALLGK